MKTLYEISTPGGQKLSPKQLSTCIWGAMAITVTIKDITSYVENLEKNQVLIPEEVVRPNDEPRTIDKPNKQETRESTGLPNGGAPETDGDKGTSDREPVA